jgi:hypothetical protein
MFGAGSEPIDSLAHRCQHYWVLTHAQVIVGTPNCHLVLQALINRLREMTDVPPKIGKDPISVFPSHDLEMRLDELIEVHCGL